jgi:hypothetical protein
VTGFIFRLSAPGREPKKYLKSESTSNVVSDLDSVNYGVGTALTYPIASMLSTSTEGLKMQLMK